jgi:hypothetical protein
MARAALLEALPSGLIWRADRIARDVPPGLPTGFGALDAELPGGGWPRDGIVELLVATPGIGELELVLPLLARSGPDRPVLWIAPPRRLFAPALAAHGVAPEQCIIVTPDTLAATLWATRQALSCGACHAVLAWMERVDMAALRRLQLAVEASATPLFLFRPPQAARTPSPAVLRLALSGSACALRIEILKRRGPPQAHPLELPLPRNHATRPHAVDCPSSARSARAGVHARRA